MSSNSVSDDFETAEQHLQSFAESLEACQQHLDSFSVKNNDPTHQLAILTERIAVELDRIDEQLNSLIQRTAEARIDADRLSMKIIATLAAHAARVRFGRCDLDLDG